MESTLFGLPAHPLLVHGVVVLLPLVAVGLVVMVVVPRSRSHLMWATLVLALVVAILTPLAAESGEELAHDVRETGALEHHEGLGENLTPFAVGLAIAAAALAGEDVWRRHTDDDGEHSDRAESRARWVRGVVGGVVVVVAVAATAQAIAVGHSGAAATWETVADG
jgi:hypothetical protein